MAERITVEQDGERITLEVPDGTTDDEIKSFLSGGAKNTAKEATAGDAVASAVQTALPAAYTPGPTGFSASAVKQTLSPMAQAGKGAIGAYIKNPLTAAVDVGMTSIGLPPPYATVEGAKG